MSTRFSGSDLEKIYVSQLKFLLVSEKGSIRFPREIGRGVFRSLFSHGDEEMFFLLK